MPARRKQAAHPNHERWLVSYADFMTLLFAFFVVMYATSQSDKGKAKQISEAVSQALDNNHVVVRLAALLSGASAPKGNTAGDKPGAATTDGQKGKDGSAKMEKPIDPKAPPADLSASLKQLTAELKKEIDAGKIRLSLEARGLVVSLTQAAFFPSGTDAIDPSAMESLGKIAAVARLLPNGIRLEGHTDSQPIHSVRFRNNWDLSAARAIAVLDVLNTKFNVPRERLAISGYAETAAIDTNDTEEGRARNRRVDIVVLTEQSMASQPLGTRGGPPAPSSTAPAAAPKPGAR
jgi:chemotaxis protein MotB